MEIKHAKYTFLKVNKIFNTMTVTGVRLKGVGRFVGGPGERFFIQVSIFHNQKMSFYLILRSVSCLVNNYNSFKINNNNHLSTSGINKFMFIQGTP